MILTEKKLQVQNVENIFLIFFIFSQNIFLYVKINFWTFEENFHPTPTHTKKKKQLNNPILKVKLSKKSKSRFSGDFKYNIYQIFTKIDLICERQWRLDNLWGSNSLNYLWSTNCYNSVKYFILKSGKWTQVCNISEDWIQYKVILCVWSSLGLFSELLKFHGLTNIQIIYNICNIYIYIYIYIALYIYIYIYIYGAFN